MGKTSIDNRLYRIYQNMIGRCTRPYNTAYKSYGGRGIKVCDEWSKKGGEGFRAFEKWALENGYQDDLKIDRINNDGNYEPNNCRWTTEYEQHKNRRVSKYIDDVYFMDFVKENKLNYKTAEYRYATGKRGKELTKLPVYRIVVVNGKEYRSNEFCKQFGFNKNSLQTAFNRGRAKQFILDHYDESKLDKKYKKTIEAYTKNIEHYT